MVDTPETAIILAAGLGTRMRPLTNDRPKPLVEVAGRPLIDYAIDRLVWAGVNRIVVNVHAFPDQMRDHLKAVMGWDAEILVSDESDLLLDSGGGIANALDLLGPDPFFAVNADLILDRKGDGLRALAAQFDPETMDAMMLFVPNRRVIGKKPAGGFFLDKQEEISWLNESEKEQAASTALMWTGTEIMTPDFFAGQNRGEAFSILPLWARSLGQSRLFGQVWDGPVCDVGTPEAIAPAEEALSKDPALVA